MNAAVDTLGLALLASLPTGALAWAVAAVMERFSREASLREQGWSLAFTATVLGVVVAAAAGLAPTPSLPPASSSVSAVAEPVVVVVRAASGAAERSWGSPPWAAALVASCVAGAAFRLGRSLLGARRLRAWVRRAQPLARPGVHTQDTTRSGAAILVSDDVDRPLLAGLRRPAVLLPRQLAETLRDEELALVCAHELAHAARRDNLRLLVERVAEGALWFNPFLPDMRARLWAAREELCDARALAQAAPTARRRYAETLVQALRLGAEPGPQTAFTGARRNIAMRVKAILDPARPVGAGPRLAAGLVAAGLLTPALVLAAGVVAAQSPGGATTSQRKSVYSFTSQTDTGPEVAVTVLADEHEERPDGTAVSRGNVELQARNAPAGMIRVDGRPQPAGFDGAAVRGRIERVEAAGAAGEAQPVFDVVTRPEASGAPRLITRPNWIRRPTAEDVTAVYPPEALRRLREGRATLDCAVTASGGLAACTIASEAPPGSGFGAAALKLAPKFLLQAATQGHRVRVPISFQAPGGASLTRPTAKQHDVFAGLKPGEIRVVADTFRDTPGDPRHVVYLGDVELAGTVPGGSEMTVLLDGERVPEGFDVRSIGLVDEVRLTMRLADGGRLTARTPPGARITSVIEIDTRR